jgi:hypothetical protein
MLKQVQHDGRGRAVRMTRHAISPRLAIRILLNIIVLRRNVTPCGVRKDQHQSDRNPSPDYEASHIWPIKRARIIGRGAVAHVCRDEIK